ncbi:MAG: hypothetical protein ACOC2U_05300 [bacterium]
MYNKNNKDRLYDLMGKINNINFPKKQMLIQETFLPADEKRLVVNDFLSYVSEELGLLENQQPKVDVDFDDNSMTQEHKSFGSYNPGTFEIKIVGCNRNLADVLRTLAHEMIHHKQNLNNELHEKSGETGSDHENTANAYAGILMREYGKKNPKIFE